MGIESVSQPWEGWAHPIYHTRLNFSENRLSTSFYRRLERDTEVESVRPRWKRGMLPLTSIPPKKQL